MDPGDGEGRREIRGGAVVGERLTGADAAWLHMDRPTNRMIVNLVLAFDECPDWDAVLDAFRERLVRPYPRLRQRVVEPAVTVPAISGPQWVDDPGFRFDSHVLHATLTAPGDAGALHAYVDAHVAEPLDPTRPLWQLHLIDGYQGGGAILLRAHHALGDGTALMHAVVALGDPEGRAKQGSAALATAPVDEPGGPSGPDAVLASASDWVTSFPRVLLGDPQGRNAMTARVGSLAKLAVVRQDRHSVLREKLGTNKNVTWCDPVALDTIKAVAKTHHATVNDVLLAAIAAALGNYLREHGSNTEQIGAMLPYNLRPLDQPMPLTWGNKFGLVYPHLPVTPMPRGDRIAAINKTMHRIKLARQANIVFGWVSTVGLTPRPVENALIDRYAGMSSVIITNVTGPRAPIRIAGSPVTGLLFWVPTSGPVGVGLSLVSYAGNINLGIMVDSGLVPDLNRLQTLMNQELQSIRPETD
jgi:WS/DGAT/MGAT family acyltransferase